MKTKEYVNKYRLSETDRINVKEFVNDLTHDFIGLLDYNKARDNIKGFENAIRAIKQKFDAINNKTAGNLNIWNYFYATKVVKMREIYCPKEMELRRKEQKERRERYEERQKREQEFSGGFSYFDYLLASMFLKSNQKPVKEMDILNIPRDTDLSADVIKTSYRTLSLTCHPDMGGKQEDFIKITRAKNTLMSYIQ